MLLVVGGTLSIAWVGIGLLLGAVPMMRWLAGRHRLMAAQTLGVPVPADYRPVPAGTHLVGRVMVWALEGDFDPATLQSNTFTMEWPPRSGRLGTFPEVDRAAWFTPPQAERKILKGQLPILDALYRKLRERAPRKGV